MSSIDNMIDNADLIKSLLGSDLLSFIVKSFNTVNSGYSYINNWHIEAVAEYLCAVRRGEIKRLIINMPPRSLKSLCVSIAFPAWLMGHDPSKRVIIASYSRDISLRHATDARMIMSSNWYSHVFPTFAFKHDQNEKSRFATTRNGFYLATSIGGALTGDGGDILILDDPHNPLQVSSNVMRNRVVDWFSGTLLTRLNNKKTGAIILVMQRLHDDDLSGYLLETSKWEHLCLPAVAEQDKIIKVGNFAYKRHVGDVLFPEREDMQELENMKQAMGSFAFSAQYQQNPIPDDGMIIKKKWLSYYDVSDLSVDGDIFFSLDTAIKTGSNNDSSVCTIWNERVDGYYLLDLYREKLEYPDLKRMVIDLVSKWKPALLLIEDKSSGQLLIQDLRRDIKVPIVPIVPSNCKVVRCASIISMIEGGRVFFPDKADWLDDFKKEILSFPNSKHDDQVDSMTQFLSWVKLRESDNSRKLARIRKF